LPQAQNIKTPDAEMVAENNASPNIFTINNNSLLRNILGDAAVDTIVTTLSSLQPENFNIPRPNKANLIAELQRFTDIGIETPSLINATFEGEFFTTAYCCEVYKHICGGNGVTASGTTPLQGITCASDWDVFKPGSIIYIEDVGIRRVEDSGSAIKGARLDVAINTHENALSWQGYGTHNVWLLFTP
jgi:3D (Asp-Asp-Asp) domain-containing protein